MGGSVVLSGIGHTLSASVASMVVAVVIWSTNDEESVYLVLARNVLAPMPNPKPPSNQDNAVVDKEDASSG